MVEPVLPQFRCLGVKVWCSFSPLRTLSETASSDLHSRYGFSLLLSHRSLKPKRIDVSVLAADVNTGRRQGR